MNKEEIKILSYLSDNLGNGGNILSMSEGIRKRHEPTYYPNIYNTIMKLEKRGIISIITDGKNRLIKLDTKNPLSIYHIAEAENEKTIGISITREIINALLDLTLDSDIITICALRQQEYAKINRIELLIIARSPNQEGNIIKALLGIESLHNTKIDPIVLTPMEFSDMLEGSELNHIRDLISDKSILYNSEGFWEIIRKYKIGEKCKSLDRFPEDLDRAHLAYNYNRFGYGLYEEAKPGKEIALEDTIFEMGASKEARIRYGAFILLRKNIKKINLPYIYYLFKRYEELDILKGILTSIEGFCDEKGKSRINAFMEMMPKQHKVYDRKLIKRYITQYG
jgi:Fe2+ or Zn2+ uptake regulation protein